MLVAGYWAEPFLDRRRTQVFSPALDAMIGKDDPVRWAEKFLREVLAEVDWSDGEAEYNGHRGQPPIHPRYLAGAMLYGMYRGSHSSRKLEEACHYRFDFIWLVEGRHMDHTTFAKFRAKFRGPLKGLFRQIGRIAMALGLIRLGEVGFDGTRVKANNSRYKTLTAKTLEEKPQALDALFEQMTAELQGKDVQQAGPDSPTPFAILKAVMGIRQFLLRGLKKVKTEWLWAVTSFNLAKLARRRAIPRRASLIRRASGNSVNRNNPRHPSSAPTPHRIAEPKTARHANPTTNTNCPINHPPNPVLAPHNFNSPLAGRGQDESQTVEVLRSGKKRPLHGIKPSMPPIQPLCSGHSC